MNWSNEGFGIRTAYNGSVYTFLRVDALRRRANRGQSIDSEINWAELSSNILCSVREELKSMGFKNERK